MEPINLSPYSQVEQVEKDYQDHIHASLVRKTESGKIKSHGNFMGHLIRFVAQFSQTLRQSIECAADDFKASLAIALGETDEVAIRASGEKEGAVVSDEKKLSDHLKERALSGPKIQEGLKKLAEKKEKEAEGVREAFRRGQIEDIQKNLENALDSLGVEGALRDIAMEMTLKSIDSQPWEVEVMNPESIDERFINTDFLKDLQDLRCSRYNDFDGAYDRLRDWELYTTRGKSDTIIHISRQGPYNFKIEGNRENKLQGKPQHYTTRSLFYLDICDYIESKAEDDLVSNNPLIAQNKHRFFQFVRGKSILNLGDVDESFCPLTKQKRDTVFRHIRSFVGDPIKFCEEYQLK